MAEHDLQREQIELYVLGALGAAERAAFEAHLASCAGCAAALEMARELERVLRTREAPRPTPQFTARIMGRLRRDRELDGGIRFGLPVAIRSSLPPGPSIHRVR